MDSNSKIQEYELQIAEIFGKNRVKVKIVENDTQVCFDSTEREILKTIRKLNPNLKWQMDDFIEVISLWFDITDNTELPSLNFEGIHFVYKNYFNERIKLITDKYDPTIQYRSQKVRNTYIEVKKLHECVNKSPDINLDNYKKIREIFDSIRYNH